MLGVSNLCEFRMTRRRPYILCNCPGRTDVRARQGYYIRAATLEDALLQMAEYFPEDWQFGFDGEFWKKPHDMPREHYEDMILN